jgi:hypothetical protein
MELNWNNQEPNDIDIDQAMCNTGISLEPRLQEYLNKKEYCDKHNVKPVIPLEKEYMITDEDRKFLRVYITNGKNLYSASLASQPKVGMEVVQALDTSFPSSKFKPDKRMERMKEKQRRDKEAIKQRHNYDDYVFGPGKNSRYEENDIMFDSLNGDTKNNSNLQSQREKVNDIYDAPIFLDSRDFDLNNPYSLNYKPDRLTKKHVEPATQYKHSYYPENMPTSDMTENGCRQNIKKPCLPHDANVDKIIGNLDSYVDHTNTIYQHSAEMDINQKVARPAFGTRGKCYYNTSQYQPIPYMGAKEGLKDINASNSLQCGYPTRGAKSYGYKNPSEHYFDYINDDLQKPEHTVLPFPRGGIQTRNDNHGRTRPVYQREILY